MATSALTLAELNFLTPTSCCWRRISVSKVRSSKQSFCTSCIGRVSLRIRVNAVKEEGPVIEGKEREFVDRLNDVKWSRNGAITSTSDIENGRNGSVQRAVNGSIEVIKSENGAINGSLVKFENENDVAATEAPEEVKDFDVEASKLKEDGRKKRLEEIGKEDAWFKQSGREMMEVAVAPGGRWSRFKTYSTIQRTLEIWGFVISFLFKSWLNNQKFIYRGGMTEEKKTSRRKALAKWLKESILRLGPTFIKIGQQFSTRVDILPQEYVDQLSELQVDVT